MQWNSQCPHVMGNAAAGASYCGNVIPFCPGAKGWISHFLAGSRPDEPRVFRGYWLEMVAVVTSSLVSLTVNGSLAEEAKRHRLA
jgi:hypothetical protein